LFERCIVVQTHFPFIFWPLGEMFHLNRSCRYVPMSCHRRH
jgi:hypothetical protein